MRAAKQSTSALLKRSVHHSSLMIIIFLKNFLLYFILFYFYKKSLFSQDTLKNHLIVLRWAICVSHEQTNHFIHLYAIIQLRPFRLAIQSFFRQSCAKETRAGSWWSRDTRPDATSIHKVVTPTRINEIWYKIAGSILLMWNNFQSNKQHLATSLLKGTSVWETIKPQTPFCPWRLNAKSKNKVFMRALKQINWCSALLELSANTSRTYHRARGDEWIESTPTGQEPMAHLSCYFL